MKSKSTGEPADRLCADKCQDTNRIWLAGALREPKSPRLNTKQGTNSQHASTVSTQVCLIIHDQRICITNLSLEQYWNFETDLYLLN